MKPSLDCMPCLVHQAINGAKRFTQDRQLQETIVKNALKQLAQFDLDRTSPEMGAIINTIISQTLGIEDLYKQQKAAFNGEMLDQLPLIRARINGAENPFAAAVKAAIIGNIIDYTAPGGKTDGDLSALLETLFERPLNDFDTNAIERLYNKTKTSNKILYLTDNAGEIVFDRLLIEQLPPAKVTAMVRGGPIANDALLEDAHVAGLDELVEVKDSGLALPGTLRHLMGPDRQAHFDAADLIISKGQGNFETIDFEPERIFFLFVIKCECVAQNIGGKVGELIITDRQSPDRIAQNAQLSTKC